MQCQNCTAQIPPQWIHALNSNICPSCGGEIMDDSSKKFLEELRDAMKQMLNQMPDNDALAEGLAGWLLSNYHLAKIGSGEPTEFFKKKNKVDAIDGEPIKYRTDDNYQKFYNLAGVKPKNNKFAQLAQQISSLNEEEMNDDDDISDNEVISGELQPSTHLVKNNVDSGAKALINNSLILSPQDFENVEPEINPYDIQELSGLFKDINPDESDDNDILSLERKARLIKQQQVINGQIRGSFRR